VLHIASRCRHVKFRALVSSERIEASFWVLEVQVRPGAPSVVLHSCSSSPRRTRVMPEQW
jgi:hypothetical protein